MVLVIAYYSICCTIIEGSAGQYYQYHRYPLGINIQRGYYWQYCLCMTHIIILGNVYNIVQVAKSRQNGCQ